jgi:two-component system chemotaxis family response regulator WspR
VARYGGEEFAIIIPNVSRTELRVFGERLCALVRDLKIPHSHGTTAGVITISVGVTSQIPAEVDAANRILKAADEALYRAKAQGRDRVVLSDV